MFACVGLNSIAQLVGDPSVGAQTTGTQSTGAQPLDDCEVLARVNSEVILACEIAWEADFVLNQRLATLPPEQIAQIPAEELTKVREQILEQMLMSRLDMALFYADFRSNAPQADLTAINKSLDASFLSQEFPMLMKRLEAKDVKDCEKKLVALGTSLAERREDYNRKMIARSWLTETVDFEKEVTHDQMLSYYRENEADYATPNRTRWEELMVSFAKYPNKREAYAAIAKIGNQAHQATLSQPATKPCFNVIAKSLSDGFTANKGGYHNWTTKGALATESVDEAIFTLPPGQMSTILEGPIGFHIVRVLEREEAGHTPFSEVQAKIKVKIKDDRFDKAIKVRVAELKQKAHVWTKFKGNLPYGDKQIASKGSSQTIK